MNKTLGLGMVSVAACAALGGVARADSDVTVTLTPDGEAFAGQNGDTPAELEAKLETKIAEIYNAARVDEYLRAFSNATSFSNRGIGVDYASNGSSLTFGIAGNVALSATDLDFNQDQNEYPVAGVAPNLTLMAGLNFGRWKLPQLTVFANGFYRKASVAQLDGSITNLGAHAQYKLFGSTQGKKSLVLKWGGLDLTGGVEWTRWSLGIGDQLTSTFDVAGDANQPITATADSTGRFDLTSSAFVIPFEATTSLRFLYVLSVFGGVGFDIQTGSSTADASLDSELTIPANGGGTTVLGNASVTADGEAGPSAGRLRFLGGLQLNVWKAKLFVQGNLIPTDTASVAFGLRVVL